MGGLHKTKVTGFRITDQSILDKLNIIATKNCRTRNKEVEFALKQYVEQYEQKNGTIKINTINTVVNGDNNGTINL